MPILVNNARGIADKHYAKACPYCDGPIPVHRRVFCSDLCGKRYAGREYKRKIRGGGQIKKCVVCGATINSQRTKYCSDKCKRTVFQKPHIPKPPREVVCVVCGKVFLTKCAAKTCSPECSKIHRLKTIKQLMKERRKSEAAVFEQPQTKIRYCLKCDKPFLSVGNRICPTCTEENELLCSGVDYHYWVRSGISACL